MKSKLNKGFHNKTLTLLWIALVLQCFPLSIYAQDFKISGLVLDEKNEPVIGATITVKETTLGTITGLDGRFSLTLPDNTKSFEVSYIGYQSQTLSIGDKRAFTVVLKESSIMMDELVVIGYGTTKKGNISGSIAKIDAEKLEDRLSTNVGAIIQGQMAGVEVQNVTGEPGQELQIKVRGSASINADATPLYIIDGIPADDLGTVNPNDIQSIDVLKDASSSAIYGSRGANGVVLITTKQADKNDRVTVNFSAAYGIQSLERKVDVMTSEEWIAYATAYYERAKPSNPSYDSRWLETNYGGLKLIDWQDELYRQAKVQDYQLSISNGRGNSRYRFSMGYLDQDGIVVETNFKRLNFRTNIETKLYDRITVGLNLAPSISWVEGGRVNGKDQMAHRALMMAPVAEADAGIYTGAEPYSTYKWASSTVSPIAYMEETSQNIERMSLSSSAFIKVDILKGLNAELTGSYNYSSSETRIFIPSSVHNKWSAGEGVNTRADRSNSKGSRYLLQGIINYNETFGKHSITAMLGYSMEESRGTSSYLRATQFQDNSLEIFDLSNHNITRAEAYLITPSRLMSYFGRAIYGYDDRYLLNVSMRRDGSSRFGPDNRWGTFPSVSLAWRVSNEAFWPEKAIVNDLKLRGSWGENGNNKIPTSAALGILSSANYSLGGALVNGFATSSFENSQLGWEKTTSWNIGVDLGLFRNRIFLSADAYIKDTKDLLYKVSVPSVLGFSNAWGNIGNIRNKGFEIEFTSRNFVGKGFNWTTSFNVSYNENKVVSLGEDNTAIYTGYDGTTQVIQVGQPLRSFYLYDAIGVYQTKEDLENYPVMYNANGTVATKLGDVRFRDVDGNGIIDDNDRTIVGKPTPDYTFGMTNTFKYKGFDLSILITGQTGGQIYSLLGRAIDRPGMGVKINALSHWQNMWVSEEQPGDGRTPSMSATTSALYDTRWLYKSDYIKIKNITLGYTIPLKKIIRNARVYVSAENVYMWDNYNGGYSPEANNGGSAGDYDYGSYPQARVVTFGLKLTL